MTISQTKKSVFSIGEDLLHRVPKNPQRLAEIEVSYNEFLKILKKSNQYQLSGTEEIRKFMDKPHHMRNIQDRHTLNTNRTKTERIQGKKLSIDIPVWKMTDSYELIKCEGSISGGVNGTPTKIQCFVACANWGELVRLGGTVNIVDHLDKLLPREGNGIGLVTFQNGINNSLEDFEKLGNSVLKNLNGDEKPLCIGLYNATDGGLFSDLARLKTRLDGVCTDNICNAHKFFSTLADKLPVINDELLWAHFAHSEGGLIAKTVLEFLASSEYCDFFKTRFVLATYGAVLPTPKTHALAAINNYSTEDTATLPSIVKPYLEEIGEEARKEYEIVILESEFTKEAKEEAKNFKGYSYFKQVGSQEYSKSQHPFPLLEYCSGGDHAFQNDTYQKALTKDMDKFRERYEFFKFQKEKGYFLSKVFQRTSKDQFLGFKRPSHAKFMF